MKLSFLSSKDKSLTSTWFKMPSLRLVHSLIFCFLWWMWRFGHAPCCHLMLNFSQGALCLCVVHLYWQHSSAGGRTSEMSAATYKPLKYTVKAQIWSWKWLSSSLLTVSECDSVLLHTPPVFWSVSAQKSTLLWHIFGSWVRGHWRVCPCCCGRRLWSSTGIKGGIKRKSPCRVGVSEFNAARVRSHYFSSYDFSLWAPTGRAVMDRYIPWRLTGMKQKGKPPKKQFILTHFFTALGIWS